MRIILLLSASLALAACDGSQRITNDVTPENMTDNVVYPDKPEPDPNLRCQSETGQWVPCPKQ